MKKTDFVRIQRKRGYTVEELGNVVFLSQGNYHATWFFLPDGSQDPDNPPTWRLDRSTK